MAPRGVCLCWGLRARCVGPRGWGRRTPCQRTAGMLWNEVYRIEITNENNTQGVGNAAADAGAGRAGRVSRAIWICGAVLGLGVPGAVSCGACARPRPGATGRVVRPGGPSTRPSATVKGEATSVKNEKSRSVNPRDEPLPATNIALAAQSLRIFFPRNAQFFP